MKKDFVFGIIIIILGLLTAFGPMSLFKVCGHGHSMKESSMEKMTEGMDEGEMTEASDSGNDYSTCHWTAQAELGVGIVITISGILLLILKTKERRSGLFIAILLNGIYALAIPTILIGVCNSTHMRCYTLTRPALVIIGVLVIITAAIRLIADNKKKES